MKAEQVIETVLGVFRNHTGNQAIQASSNIKDIKLDSLDKVEVIMKLEEEFGIDIPEDNAVKFLTSTVSDIANEVTKHLEIEEHGGNPSFEEMVAGLVKPGEDIVRGLKDDSRMFLETAIQQAIDASRIIDAAKKEAVYGKRCLVPVALCPDINLRDKLTPHLAHKLHMAIGLFGEAGEILEAVVNEIVSGDRDCANEIEEAGDLEFYAEGHRQSCGITRAMAIEHNIYKLGKRYKGHRYTDAQAIARADKAQDIHESPRQLDAGRAFEPMSTADADSRDIFVR